MRSRIFVFTIILIMFIALGSMGCATKKYVNQGFAQVDKDMNTMQNSIEDNQSKITENQKLIKDNEGNIIHLSEQTKAAMAKIESVEKLAMGKLLYQVTLDNDAVKFNSGVAELTEGAKGILDELVDMLIRQNKNVFIEIQGHTDSTGDEEYNNTLGLKRAESVRRYLSSKGIPLHRMSVISYGETKPVADNDTPEGRAQNRRVVLLILE